MFLGLHRWPEKFAIRVQISWYEEEGSVLLHSNTSATYSVNSRWRSVFIRQIRTRIPRMALTACQSKQTDICWSHWFTTACMWGTIQSLSIALSSSCDIKQVAHHVRVVKPEQLLNCLEPAQWGVSVWGPDYRNRPHQTFKLDSNQTHIYEPGWTSAVECSKVYLLKHCTANLEY